MRERINPEMSLALEPKTLDPQLPLPGALVSRTAGSTSTMFGLPPMERPGLNQT